METKGGIKNVRVRLLKIRPEEVKDGGGLQAGIGVDSTEMVELVIALGKEVNVKIEQNEITKDSTLEEIEGVIKSRVG